MLDQIVLTNQLIHAYYTVLKLLCENLLENGYTFCFCRKLVTQQNIQHQPSALYYTLQSYAAVVCCRIVVVVVVAAA